MRKFAAIALAVVMIMSLAACGQKSDTEATEATQAAQTETQVFAEPETEETVEAPEEEQPSVGMPNPMAQVEADVAFPTELGIYIDAHKLPVYPDAMFIIAGDMADVRFTLENVEGEDVEYCLRATKNAENAEMMHGIFDENIEEINTVEAGFDADKCNVKEMYSKSADTNICTWEWNDTFFSLTYSGVISQMQFAEVMDSVLMATGMGSDFEWYSLEPDNQIITFHLLEKDGEKYDFEISDKNVIDSLTFEHTADDPSWQSNIGEFAGSFKAFNGAGEATITFTSGDKVRSVDIKVSDDNSLEVVSDKKEN